LSTKTRDFESLQGDFFPVEGQFELNDDDFEFVFVLPECIFPDFEPSEGIPVTFHALKNSFFPLAIFLFGTQINNSGTQINNSGTQINNSGTQNKNSGTQNNNSGDNYFAGGTKNNNSGTGIRRLGIGNMEWHTAIAAHFTVFQKSGQ